MFVWVCVKPGLYCSLSFAGQLVTTVCEMSSTVLVRMFGLRNLVLSFIVEQDYIIVLLLSEKVEP